MKLSETESIEKIELNKLIKRNIRIPSCQRDINENRIKELVDKVSTNKNLIFKMSPLIIGNLDNELYILDGQHRYFAFSKIKAEYIIVQFIKVKTYDELKDLFYEINQNTPLPINWLELPTKDKIIHKLLMKKFKSIWNNVLSDANKPRIPQVKKKEFEEILILNPQIKINHIISLNNKLKSIIVDKSKYEKKNFYLSISDNLKGDLLKIINKQEIFIVKKYKKQSIGAILRREVWRKEFGIKVGEAECPYIICRNKINTFDFECGHIISERNGGNTDINNLRPICKQCNCSMGSKNWI